MSLTPDGQSVVASLFAGALAGSVIRISGADETAEVAAELAMSENGEIVLRAEFGELAANFDWQVRDVVTADGVVVDRDAETDMGRKPIGAIWTVEVPIAVVA